MFALMKVSEFSGYYLIAVSESLEKLKTIMPPNGMNANDGDYFYVITAVEVL